VTCVAVGALARSEDPAVKPALLKAQAYILALQNVEKQGYQRKDRDYGSIGYGDMQRGDLSNTQFAMEALRLTGLPADHEAFAKAMVFLQRTQNLKSVNDFAGKVPDAGGQLMDVGSGDDGGAAYYPGNSPMGYIDLPDGTKVPRSYGSMTYALLKAYTLAGVKPDDARIMAAVKWLQGNWTLSENPGADPKLLAGKDGEKIKYQGLFYYYMVLAQALDGAGLAELQTAGKDGKVEVVAWRKALRSHLEAQQQQDGTWVNSKNDRWYEGMPLLATAYAMLALEHCR
jgi:squalene-hopene/tetraprenyl-beta-curcumene cyclase